MWTEYGRKIAFNIKIYKKQEKKKFSILSNNKKSEKIKKEILSVLYSYMNWYTNVQKMHSQGTGNEKCIDSVTIDRDNGHRQGHCNFKIYKKDVYIKKRYEAQNTIQTIKLGLKYS